LAAFETYMKHVGANSTRDCDAVSANTLMALAQRLRRQPAAAPQQGSLSRLDGAALVRTERLVRPKDLRGRTGRLILDGGGQFVRQCEPGIDAQGAIVLENLPELPAGNYIMSAAFNVLEGFGEIAQISLKTLTEDDPIEQTVEISTRASGYVQRTIPFSVSLGSEGLTRELIVIWHGQTKLDFLSLRFRTAD